MKEISANGALLSEGALCGEIGAGHFFTGDTGGYVQKALATGMSLHSGSAGEPGRGIL